jgi:NDP-sugar pyrophosphorylase family protein
MTINLKTLRRGTLISKAMIMAAGVGSRLDPLTQTTPKPLIPLANKPIMELILNHLKAFGVNEVIANTHYLADKIHKQFENNELGIDFSYLYEEELSGTAGGVKKCESFFTKGQTFIVMSGDSLTDVDLESLVQKHKQSGAIATMALREVPMQEVNQFGVVVTDDDGKILGFQEKPSVHEAKSNLVNTGIYVFETKIFDYIPANQFYDFAKNVFPALMSNNELLYGYKINSYWNDIGTLNQYRLSSYDLFTDHISINPDYDEFIHGWKSETAVVSNEAVFKGKVVLGINSSAAAKVKFYGNSIIGNNCIIEEGAEIKNAIIWDNVIVRKYAKLDGCIVANNVEIGENSILLPGCVVADNCKIYANQKLNHDVKLNPSESFGTVVKV